MNELVRDIAEQLTESLQKGITDEAWKSINKSVDQIRCDIEGDIEYRLKEDLAGNLSCYVADMAEKVVKAILEGNEDQMRRYLGCEHGHWNGRSDGAHGYGRKQTDAEQHPVIHGKLFEQGAIRLRKDIVAAHSEMIVSERILDLEDQVKSLVAQVNKAIFEREKMWERVRELT